MLGISDYTYGIHCICGLDDGMEYKIKTLFNALRVRDSGNRSRCLPGAEKEKERCRELKRKYRFRSFILTMMLTSGIFIRDFDMLGGKRNERGILK
jgi:hypothetical protein